MTYISGRRIIGDRWTDPARIESAVAKPDAIFPDATPHDGAGWLGCKRRAHGADQPATGTVPLDAGAGFAGRGKTEYSLGLMPERRAQGRREWDRRGNGGNPSGRTD